MNLHVGMCELRVSPAGPQQLKTPIQQLQKTDTAVEISVIDSSLPKAMKAFGHFP